MLVKVKGKGVKLNGKWCYKEEEATINEAEWEENKEYLDIIKDDEGDKLPQVPENDENELLELRKKGKELGIKNAHLMGKEKLEQLIAEKDGENPNSNEQNEYAKNEKVENTEDGNDTDVGSNGESSPQE